MTPGAPIDRMSVTAAAGLQGEDATDTKLLRQHLSEAREYLRAFDWCQRIVAEFFGAGVGGLFGVFLFQIQPSRPGVDDWLWVVSGDLPPLYLVTDDLPTPKAALAEYVSLVHEWTSAVKAGEDTQGLVPINVPPTQAWADKLESRLEYLEKHFLR